MKNAGHEKGSSKAILKQQHITHHHRNRVYKKLHCADGQNKM